MSAQKSLFGDDPPISLDEMLGEVRDIIDGKIVGTQETLGAALERRRTILKALAEMLSRQAEARRRVRRVEEIPADDWLLIEVKGHLRRNAERGVSCPACGQLAKVYRRTFHSTNARALLALYRHFEANTRDEWVHMPTLMMSRGVNVNGGEDAKMRFFGVVELKADRSDQKGTNHSGYYRITKLGVDFARGEARIPKFVRIYDGEPLPRRADDPRDQETVSIREALGTKFSYEELMQQT